MTDISVLIPAYNSENTLAACLEHLAAQTVPAERFEVIVTLDGATDGSRRILETAQTPYHLRIIAQERQGKAAAINRAAAAAAGEILVMIDSDILPAPAFIESHIRAHAQADVVIGPIPLAPRCPINFLTDGVRRWADEHARNMTDRAHDLSSADFYGANFSIRKDAFIKLGGYRTDLRRTEDFHLGEKILRAGLTVRYCPQAIAAQIYDKTFLAWCDDFYTDGKSHAALLREYPELRPKLRAGRFYPQSLAKRIIRPLVTGDHPLGRALVAAVKIPMELARRMGLRWSWLTRAQGVLGDALYWKGVYDAVGGGEHFRRFIHGEDAK